MKRKLFSLLLLFFAVSFFGQNNTKSGEASKTTTLGPLTGTYTVEDPYFTETRDTASTKGPISITRNILQDKNDNFWFATWQGVMRYDGNQFVNYTLKDRLRHFHVFSLLEDTKGNLWFGTIRGGVYRYDGKTFTLFTTREGLANDIVTCITEDKNGNIWFGTDDGVTCYDGKTMNNFTGQSNLKGHSVNWIMQDKTGKLWFGTRYGNMGDVSCYDGKYFSVFTNKEGIKFSNVRNIIEDKTGKIWIGGQDGLFSYDGKTLLKISPAFVGYLFEDKKGTIWISQAEEKGMALYKYEAGAFTKIAANSQVFGIIEDKAGNIWYGTPNGAYKYDGKTITGFSGK